MSDEAPEERIVDRLITRRSTTFGRRVDLDALDDVVESFEAGLVIETGDLPRRASTCAGCTRRRASPRRSAAGAFDVTDGPGSRRSSRPRSSSCSRACTSPAGSTRIAPRRPVYRR